MKRTVPALIMLAGLTIAGCAQRSPTEPQPQSLACTNPARLVISVTPLLDPEAFALNIDDRYDLAGVAARLRGIPGVTNIRQYDRTHFITADLRPAAIDSVRCVPGVTDVAQGRTNIPPAR